MTTLDWIIVAFAVLLALVGWGQGFVVSALSLAGFALGAVLGTRLAPVLLHGGASSPYAPVFGLLGACLAGFVLAAGFSGMGAWLRAAARRVPGFRAVDGVLGALLSAAVGLGIAWVVGAVALQAPGQFDLRRQVQRSAVLSTLNDVLPPSGPILNALARFDQLPTLHGPSADVPPPSPRIALDPDIQAAARSVVKVLGTACGLGVEGSGWVTTAGLVVTNAHVVAGEHDTAVEPPGMAVRLPAQAVAFNAIDDVAVLRVRGLQAPGLPMADDPPSGTAAALLGYPQDGPFDVRAARIGSEHRVVSQDAYGHETVTRAVLPLRGLVRHGNSGGPLVDAQGRVVGTVFAATVGERRHGGFAVPNGVVRDVLGRARGPVSTGPCAR